LTQKRLLSIPKFQRQIEITAPHTQNDPSGGPWNIESLKGFTSTVYFLPWICLRKNDPRWKTPVKKNHQLKQKQALKGAISNLDTNQPTNQPTIDLFQHPALFNQPFLLRS